MKHLRSFRTFEASEWGAGAGSRAGHGDAIKAAVNQEDINKFYTEFLDAINLEGKSKEELLKLKQQIEKELTPEELKKYQRMADEAISQNESIKSFFTKSYDKFLNFIASGAAAGTVIGGGLLKLITSGVAMTTASEKLDNAQLPYEKLTLAKQVLVNNFGKEAAIMATLMLAGGVGTYAYNKWRKSLQSSANLK
jgi:hypothetical protein